MHESRGRKNYEVKIPIPGAQLSGQLVVPVNSSALVAFSHGSGSSRFSPRNQIVAGVLNSAGFSTLLLDLLTPTEEAVDRYTGHIRFNIEFLSDRMIAAVTWLAQNEVTRKMSIGLLGASTGSAAALTTASQLPKTIAAVVSRGGRPDLVDAKSVQQVVAPTLLIVGGNDKPVIEMNKFAFAQLQCVKKLEIVPGASHLFEEPGTMEQVSDLAVNWFQSHLLWSNPSGSFINLPA